MVAERSFAGKKGVDCDRGGGNPVSDPGLEDVPVELLNLGRAERIETELVKALVDDGAAELCVYLNALLAVAAGDHAVGDGPEIGHDEEIGTLRLVDGIHCGVNLVLFEVRVEGGGIRGDRVRVEGIAVGGEDHVELRLKAANGRLHEMLASDEQLVVGNPRIGHERFHRAMKIGDGAEERLRLFSALVEDGGFLGKGGSFWVPFGDDLLFVGDVLSCFGTSCSLRGTGLAGEDAAEYRVGHLLFHDFSRWRIAGYARKRATSI